MVSSLVLQVLLCVGSLGTTSGQIFVDPIAISGDSCGSPESPCNTITTALARAAAESEGVVVMGPGLYPWTGNCDLSIDRPVMLRAARADFSTIVDCEHKSRFAVVSAAASFEGIWFSNGSAVTDETGPKEFRPAVRQKQSIHQGRRARKIRVQRIIWRDEQGVERDSQLQGISLLVIKELLSQWATTPSQKRLLQKFLQSLRKKTQNFSGSRRRHARTRRTTADADADGFRWDAPDSLTHPLASHHRRTNRVGTRSEHTGASGVIAYGDPSKQYPPDVSKDWVIHSPTGNLKLSFVRLDIAPVEGRGCRYDSVTLYDGATTVAPVIGIYCGALPRDVCLGNCPPNNAIVAGRSVTVRFFSNFASMGTGFQLNWTTTSQEEYDTVLARRNQLRGGALLVIGASVSLRLARFTGNEAMDGGGVAGYGAQLVLQDVLMENNRVSRFGAGLFVEQSSLVLASSSFVANTIHCTTPYCSNGGTGVGVMNSVAGISNSHFLRNVGTCHARGCNIFGTGLLLLFSNASVVQVDISHQVTQCDSAQCQALGGGALSIGSAAQIVNSTFTHNRMICEGHVNSFCYACGGGFFGLMGGNVLEYCTVANNSVLGNYPLGGGVYLDGLGEMLIKDSVISYAGVPRGNSALSLNETAGGGGILVLQGTLSIVGSTVLENLVSGPKQGGGGGVMLAAKSQMLAVGCTIAFNSVFGDILASGGGIGLIARGISAKIDRSVIMKNAVRCNYESTAGAISMQGALVQMDNSLIAENMAMERTEQEFLTACGDFVEDNPTSHSGILALQYPCGRFGLSQTGVHSDIGWTIQLPDVRKKISLQQVEFEIEYFVECLSDSVWIYDGASQFSTPFGRYCGWNSSVDCSAGPCPALSHIISSSHMIHIRHVSDNHHVPGTFILAWSSVDAPTPPTATVQCGASGVTITEVSTAEAAGAGLWLFYSGLTMENTTIAANQCHHPLICSGGGMSLRSSVVQMRGSVISNNSLEAFQAFGGGVDVARGSQLLADGANVQGNEIYAHGKTFHSGGRTHCPIGMGAGIAVAGLVQVTLTRQTLESNSAYCEGYGCSASGGALWSSGGAATTITNSSLLLNEAWCQAEKLCRAVGGGISSTSLTQLIVDGSFLTLNDADCQSPSGVAQGGAIHSVGARLRVHRTTLVDNVAFGGAAPSGGAMFYSNFLGSVLSSSWMSLNQASIGGAVQLSGVCELQVHHTLTETNEAVFGGAISLTDAAVLLMDHSTFSRDTALVAHEFYSNSRSVLTQFFNSSVIMRANITALLLGRLPDGRLNGSLWKCDTVGTEGLFVAASSLDQSRSSDLWQMTCSVCGPGTYSILAADSTNRAQCFDCPSGGRCLGGQNIHPLNNRWGFAWPDGRIEFTLCRDGYCCSQADDACVYDHCAHNRTGILCGTCAPGYSQAIFQADCVPDDQCNAAPWLVPLTVCLTLAVAIAMCFATASQTRKLSDEHQRYGDAMWRFEKLSDGAEITILVYFYQILPLVLSEVTKQKQSRFAGVIFSSFNFQLNFGDQAAICLWPGFSTLDKLYTAYAAPVLVLAWLVVSLLVVKIRQRVFGCPKRVFALHCAAVVSSIVLTATLVFSVVLRTTFELVACVEVGGELRLISAGTTVCYATWQKALMGLLIPFLLALPLLLWRLLVWMPSLSTEKNDHAHANAESTRLLTLFGLRHVLTQPYHAGAGYWEVVLMLQRLVLVALTTFLSHPLVRSVCLGVSNLATLLIHTTIAPYIRSGANRLQSWCLSLLVVVSLWECAISLVYTPNGSSDLVTPTITDVFSFLVIAITLLPLLGVLVVYAREVWHLSKKRRRETAATTPHDTKTPRDTNKTPHDTNGAVSHNASEYLPASDVLGGGGLELVEEANPHHQQWGWTDATADGVLITC